MSEHLSADVPTDPAECLSAARDLLPAWVWPQFPILGMLAGLLVLGAAAWLAMWWAGRPLRKCREAHWTERARRAWPQRRLCMLLGLALPLFGILFGQPWRLPFWNSLAIQLVGALLGLAVAFALSYRSEQVVFRERLELRRSLKVYLWSLLLLMPSVPVAWGLFILLPLELNGPAVALLAGGAAVMLLLTLGMNVPLGRALGLLQPASERLRAIVQRCAERQGMPAPVAYITPHVKPNAFAFPFARCLGFAQGMIEQLPEEEIEAVCDHELAHLREPRRVLAARLAGSLLLLCLVAMKPVAGSHGWTALPVLCLVYLLGIRWLLRLSHRMEQQADAAAQAHEADEGIYARALERVHELSLIPAVLAGTRNTHPHLYDRMTAAGVTPDFERPAPPSNRRAAIPFLALMLLAAYLPWSLEWTAIRMAYGSDLEPAGHVALLLVGERVWIYDELGACCDAEDRLDEAATYYGAAAAFGPHARHYRTLQAARLTKAGHFDAASAVMAEFLEPMGDSP